MPANARTERPPFDPDDYARESEERLQAGLESRHQTAPPPAEHAALRDSCKQAQATAGAYSFAGEPTGNEEEEPRLDPMPSLGAIPVSLAAPEDFEWFDLGDHGRAIVASIDDRRTVEEILAATGTPLAEGLAVFHELVRQGLVTLL
jgi:hypothetical protein